MAKKAKSFFKLTAAERDASVSKFDAGVDFDMSKPLSPAQSARFERARSTIAAHSNKHEQARVLINVDPKLLVKAHAKARLEGKTFSELVADLLKAAVRRAG